MYSFFQSSIEYSLWSSVWCRRYRETQIKFRSVDQNKTKGKIQFAGRPTGHLLQNAVAAKKLHLRNPINQSICSARRERFSRIENNKKKKLTRFEVA